MPGLIIDTDIIVPCVATCGNQSHDCVHCHIESKNIYLTKKYFQWLVSVLLLAAAAAQDVSENEIADLPSAVGEGITRPISEESRRERLRSGVSSLTRTPFYHYHIII